jgi:Domain of unknown function (DUF4139)
VKFLSLLRRVFSFFLNWLTKVMGCVSFVPHYTLRAQSSGSDSSLKIRYHARISNHSGEDWNDVSLAISTAVPSETTVVPRMQRWTLNFIAPVMTKSAFGSKAQSSSSFLGVGSKLSGASNNIYPNAGQSMDAQQQFQRQFQPQMAMQPPGRAMATGALLGAVVGHINSDSDETDMIPSGAEVSEGITSTFTITGKQTIKDGERNHTVVIQDLVFYGKFANICVPKVKPVAYLHVYPNKSMTDLRLELRITRNTLYFQGKSPFSWTVPL